MYRILLVLFLFWLTTPHLSAQLRLKIEALPGGEAWGVFVKPCSEVIPTNNTITGSGQVTIHFPKGLTFMGFAPFSGNWNVNATVVGPVEAPNKTYVSIGFLSDNPKIVYHPDFETLLFTFKLAGTGAKNPELLENGVDPFDHLPNSMGTNPGNELGVIDFGIIPTGFYDYSGIYTNDFFSCNATNPQDTTTTNPQDTTVINPQDTTTVNPQDTSTINPQDTTTTNPQDTTVILPQDTTSNPQDTTISSPSDTSKLDSDIASIDHGDTEQPGSTTTGTLDAVKPEPFFKASPNPAFDWVTVTFFDEAPAEGYVRLWSINGSVIGTLMRGSHDSLKLNIERLSSGLYFLSYEKDGKVVQRERIIKQ